MLHSEWKRAPEQEKGVIAGSDAQQEWLLPWWWERYSETNAYPVTFVDFGMTEKVLAWCRERGDVVSLHSPAIAPKKKIDPHLKEQWDSWGRWEAREAWFKKPFALLQSPYRRSVWIDLDCEVLSSIEELFDFSENSIALARERQREDLPRLHPDVIYNGGVIAYRHGAPIIQHWADGAMMRNHCFPGSDWLLSALIYEQKLEIEELPEIYNWRIVKGVNLNAVIVHWVGAKNFIKEFGGLRPLLDKFYGS